MIQVNGSGESTLLLPCVQGTSVVGESSRQHRHHSVRQVHGGATAHSFFIQQAALPHIMGNVCNVYTKSVALRCFLYTNSVIQILGVGAVNGENRQVGKVCPLCTLFLGD